MRLIGLYFVAFLALPGGVAMGAQIKIDPGPGAIQTAINASSPGDEIVVSRGTYNENISFGGKNITLRSTDPTSAAVVATTIIDGGGVNSVVRFQGTEGSTCTLSGFTIRRGYAVMGGGVLGNNCQATLSHNRFLWNHATWDGGGVYGVDGLVENNLFAYNFGQYHGGGFCWAHGPSVIRNNIFAFNTTGGNGAAISDGYGLLINNVAYGNRAEMWTGGFYYVGTVVNCIFWNNTGGLNPNLQQYYAPPVSSCIQGWTGDGTGNITSDPRFVAPALLDFRLMPDSPCIDAGTATAAPATDFFGIPRPVDIPGVGADGTGAEIDMGVDESSPYTLAFAAAASGHLESASSATLTVLAAPRPLPGTAIDFLTSGGTATTGGVDCVLPTSGTLWFDTVSTAPAVYFEQAALLPTIGVDDVEFGAAVAIDGDTAVVGARNDNERGAKAGAAYVLVRSGDDWVQQAKLLGSDTTAGDVFGVSVAISGNTIAVGAPYHNSVGALSGAVYVFTRSGTTWTQQTRITPAGLAGNDQLGFSVALSGDTLLAGAWYDDDSGTDSGSAYVYRRVANSWSQQAKLLPSDGTTWDNFGYAVALDANTALVASFGDDQGAYDHGGSVYVFARSGTAWSQQAKLTASDAAEMELFGSYGVAVKGDTAVVAAYDSANEHAGAAYLFERNGTTWSQRTKLAPFAFPSVVPATCAVATDGNSVAVGSMEDDGALADAGAVFVYSRRGTEWVERQELRRANSCAGDSLGCSTAMDGPAILAGALRASDAIGGTPGAAYLFDIEPVSIPVEIIDDAIDEWDETVQLTLLDPATAELESPTSHTLTILDDDDSPSIAFGLECPAQIAEAATTATLSLRLSGNASAKTIVADCLVTSATAGPDDFDFASPYALSFAPGERDKVVRLLVNDDAIDEFDETILLALSNLQNASVGTSLEHGLAILDDDDPPALAIRSESTSQIDESASTATLIAALSGNATEKTVSFSWTVAADSAEPGDFVATPMNVILQPGATVSELEVLVQDDSTDEEDETVLVGFTGLLNAAAASPSSSTLTILDNDESPVVALSRQSIFVTESCGSFPAALVLSGNQTERAVTVEYAGSNGSALAGSDFETIAGSIMIEPPDRAAQIDCVIVNDTAAEGLEDFYFDLTGNQNAWLGLARARIWIDDDEQRNAVGGWRLYN